MTLRLLDDSIRLRLSPSEIDQFAAAGRLATTVHVAPNAALMYALEVAETGVLRAEFENDTLTVSLPRSWVEQWVAGKRVGFEGAQRTGDGSTLRILVELDLGCDHRPDHRKRRATNAG